MRNGKSATAAARWLGIQDSRTSHAERLASVLGALLGMAAVIAVSRWWLGQGNALFLVASMGASAVLLFAVPHGPLSQPWPLLGGHLVSATVGVACARWIEPTVPAAVLAVAGAIGAMHYLRCIHPPGGATALSAVLGGPSVDALGFGFVLAPVGVNALLMLAAAVAVNALLPWRRYPVGRVPASAEEAPEAAPLSDQIAHEDLVYALSELDSFVDIDEDDLLRIYHLATRSGGRNREPPLEIVAGRCYSNARPGSDWAVRRVVDLVPVAGVSTRVLFREVAGAGRGRQGSIDLAAFTAWARHEVVRRDSAWHRVARGPAAD